jgi:hypothetical protein
MPVTLCPVALVSSCTKCPIFKVCPLKGVIGDYRPDADGGSTDKPSPTGADAKKPHGRERDRPKRSGGRRARRRG